MTQSTSPDEVPFFGFSERRLETAAAFRELAHLLSSADADDAQLKEVSGSITDAIAALRSSPRRRREIPDFASLAALRDAGIDVTDHALGDRAVAGPANPTSIEIETERHGDEATAIVTFGPAFEGAPGRVHGGLIAAVFDDLTGYALSVVQQPGFTGRLTVNFLRPMPIETPIIFHARIDAHEGRKLHVAASASLDGEELSTAEALFILVDREHFLTRAAELTGRTDSSPRNE